MDYRIERVEGGAPVPTDAIRIAELLGLDEDILAFIDDVNGKSGAAKEEERTSQK